MRDTANKDQDDEPEEKVMATTLGDARSNHQRYTSGWDTDPRVAPDISEPHP